MTPLGPAKPSLTSFLEALRTSGGLRFEYTITTHEPDPAASQPPLTEVLLTGPDTPLLLARNGELLHALESLAAAILRLEPEQVEQLSFDAEGFKAGRLAAIGRLAEDAITSVNTLGKPFVFAPMNSRERRLLHLALVPSGLATASSGFAPRRFVVLYPAGQTPDPEQFNPPAHRPGAFRNHGSYKSAGPLRGPGSAPDPRSSEGATGDPEGSGNRAGLENSSSSSPVDEESTRARLDSIRRAFRKR